MMKKVLSDCMFPWMVALLFLLVPLSNVHCQVSGEAPVVEDTGDTGFQKENPAARQKIGRMSDEEIDRLDEKLAEALILYYDRDFTRAFPIFQDIADTADTMDVMFWYGTCAMEVGDPETAIDAFTKMLQIDPELHNIRLELAIAYFSVGRHDDLRSEVERIQSGTAPPLVKENARKLLAALEEGDERISWFFQFSQGILFDDNASTGPDRREYTVVGGSITPTRPPAEVSDEASVTSLVGNMLFDGGEKNGFMWNTSASFYNKAYFDYSEFNFLRAAVNTGPWFAGSRDIVKVPVGYAENRYGNDRLSNQGHVDVDYEHYFSNIFGLKGFYSFAKENFYSRSKEVLDNTHHRFAVTPKFYLLERSHILSASAGYNKHNADGDQYSYDGPYYTLSYFARFKTNTEFFLQYQYAEKEFDSASLPLYLKRRNDEQNSFTAVVTQNFLKYFFASLSFNYTDSNSNHSLYDYERTTLTANMGCRF